VGVLVEAHAFGNDVSQTQVDDLRPAGFEFMTVVAIEITDFSNSMLCSLV
jgi:hypothetical protein